MTGGPGPAAPAQTSPLTAWLRAINPGRGLVYAINVGVPTLIADLAGHGPMTLLCGFVGLFLSFADTSGGLAARWRIGLCTLGGIIVGGVAGQLIGRLDALFWVTYAVVVFIAGLGNHFGPLAQLASRFGAIALVVGVSIARLDNVQSLLLLLVPIATALATRTIEHVLTGAAPLTSNRPPAVTPQSEREWLRYALAYTAAGCIALWFAGQVSATRLMWIPAITLAVMLPDVRASYARIVDCMLGAFAGALIAWPLVDLLRASGLIHGAIFVVAFFVPSQLTTRYWLHTGLIAALVMLLYDLAMSPGGFDRYLLVVRIEDMLLGCGIALVGTALAFRERPYLAPPPQ